MSVKEKFFVDNKESNLLLNQITVPTINQVQFDGSLVTDKTPALSFKP